MAPDASADWDINQTTIWIIYRGSPAPAALNDKDVSSALESVNNAVRTSKLAAWGRLSPAPEPRWYQSFPPRERIPAGVIDERRQINMFGRVDIIASDEAPFDFVHDRGPWFHEVCFRAADVMAVWPAPSEQSSETDEAADTTTAAEGQPTTALVAQTAVEEGSSAEIAQSDASAGSTPVVLAEATVEQIDVMLRGLWENRADKSLGLARDKELKPQWRQALTALGLTSTWGMVHARYTHKVNLCLRGSIGVTSKHS